MKIEIMFLSLCFLMVTANGMEVNDKDLMLFAQSNSFKMRQLQRLARTMPEIKKALIQDLEQKKADAEHQRGKTKQGVSYQGPQVYDTISANRCINDKRFVLADFDEPATDIYQAQSPFEKTMNLKETARPYGINALDVNHLGDTVATDQGNQILLWDLTTQKSNGFLQGHTDLVTGIDFYPGNSYILVSGSKDKTLKIWDTRTNKCTQTLNDSAPVLSVDFSPDGENVASVNNSGIAALTLWSLAQSKGIAKTTGAWTANFNHTGTNIIAGLPGKLILYKGSTLETIRSLALPESWVKNNAIPGSFDFSADDSIVLASGPLSDIFICKGDLSAIEDDIDSGMLGVDAHFYPNGQQILSSTYCCAVDAGPYVRIWDIENKRKKIREVQIASQEKEEKSRYCFLQ